MDDFKSTVTNITKSIAKTSGDFIKTAKLSMSISNEEAELKNLYAEIGKKVHEIYAYGGSIGPYFDEKYKEAEELENKIKELKKQLDIAKGVRTCPKCGKTAPSTSEFCPKCGATIENRSDAPVGISVGAEPPELIQQNSNTSLSQTEKKCAVCGSANSSSEKFCLSCGRML